VDGGTTVVEEKEIKKGRKEDACCVSGMENKQMGKKRRRGEGQEKEGKGATSLYRFPCASGE